MGHGHKGKCFGFILLLLCFSSTFAHRLLMDPLPTVKKPQPGEGVKKLQSDNLAKPNVRELEPDFKVVKPMLNEKDHEILPELDLQHGVVPKIDGRRKFGSGTNLGGAACGTCGEFPGGGEGSGGGFPTLELEREGHKSDIGTINKMTQAVASQLP